MKTVRSLLSSGIELPRHDYRAKVCWKSAAVWSVAAILHNPAYVGDYHFGRKRTDFTKDHTPRGYRRLRKAPEEALIVTDHHQAYVSREDFAEIQEILLNHAATKARRNLGPGPALLQALVRCGSHNRRAMRVHYTERGRGRVIAHSYRCLGALLAGGKNCASIPGNKLNQTVTDLAVLHLCVPRLELIRAEWERARNWAGDEAQRHQAALDRARKEVDAAKRHCLAVNPEHRAVAERYEALWEEAEQRLRQLECGERPENRNALSSILLIGRS